MQYSFFALILSTLLFATNNLQAMELRLTGRFKELGNLKGLTPLHRAALTGDVEKASRLLAQGVDPSAQCANGHTPLHLSILRRRTEVSLLLIKWADLDAQNRWGNSPAHYAVVTCQLGVLCALRKYGAKKSIKNNKNQTPKDCAGYYNQKNPFLKEFNKWRGKESEFRGDWGRWESTSEGGKFYFYDSDDY